LSTPVIQPQNHHQQNIFFKFEEMFFRWLIWTTFLQIFSHQHDQLVFLGNVSRRHEQMTLSARVWRWTRWQMIDILCKKWQINRTR
jgi:hypothetical protein